MDELLNLGSGEVSINIENFINRTSSYKGEEIGIGAKFVWGIWLITFGIIRDDILDGISITLSNNINTLGIRIIRDND